MISMLHQNSVLGIKIKGKTYLASTLVSILSGLGFCCPLSWSALLCQVLSFLKISFKNKNKKTVSCSRDYGRERLISEIMIYSSLHNSLRWGQDQSANWSIHSTIHKGRIKQHNIGIGKEQRKTDLIVERIKGRLV